MYVESTIRDERHVHIHRKKVMMCEMKADAPIITNFAVAPDSIIIIYTAIVIRLLNTGYCRRNGKHTETEIKS